MVGVKVKKSNVLSLCLHVYMTMFWSGEQIIVLLSFLCTPLSLSPHTLPHLPHHSDSWKQNSSDSFCCFSLSQLPHSPHHSPIPLTVVIGSAGIIQRLDIIYCLPCTIPPSHSHPLSQSHKVPCGWTNHTWNIISASYSSILWTALFLWCNGFNPCLVILTPVCAGRKRVGGWVGGVGGQRER